MHVLLIEPDVLLAESYRQALVTRRHTVVVVQSAQTAVHAADEAMPDVVVLELQLPHHNGVEFLYEFRSYSEWLHIPVIVLSYIRPIELEAMSTLRDELGVRRILYKPATSLTELCETVARAVPAAV